MRSRDSSLIGGIRAFREMALHWSTCVSGAKINNASLLPIVSFSFWNFRPPALLEITGIIISNQANFWLLVYVILFGTYLSTRFFLHSFWSQSAVAGDATVGARRVWQKVKPRGPQFFCMFPFNKGGAFSSFLNRQPTIFPTHSLAIHSTRPSSCGTSCRTGATRGAEQTTSAEQTRKCLPQQRATTGLVQGIAGGRQEWAW